VLLLLCCCLVGVAEVQYVQILPLTLFGTFGAVQMAK
jgi:hypothetical protein